MYKLLRFSLLTTTALTLTACSSTPSTAPLAGETVTSSTHQQGVPGGVLTETTVLDARVVALDPAERKVTLADSRGAEKTITCGPEVINFDQIRVGDQVHVTVASKLELAMAREDMPVEAAGVTQATLAPAGAKPGGIISGLQEYTASIKAINTLRREVTLQFPDDTSKTFPVRPDIDLSQRKVGEKVAIRVSVAVAISVHQP